MEINGAAIRVIIERRHEMENMYAAAPIIITPFRRKTLTLVDIMEEMAWQSDVKRETISPEFLIILEKGYGTRFCNIKESNVLFDQRRKEIFSDVLVDFFCCVHKAVAT